jgi:hypothetical protein
MGITNDIVSSMQPVPPQLSHTQWFSRPEGIRNRYGMLCAIIHHGSLQQRQEVLELMAQEGDFDESDRALVLGVFDYSIRVEHRAYKSTDCLARATLPWTFIARLFPDGHAPIQQAAAVERAIASSQSSVSQSSTASFSEAGLKIKLLERDLLCLFCWCSLVHTMNAAHILARKLKDMPDIPSDSMRALLDAHGIVHVNDVRNGILLCQSCHTLFDNLELYVERVGPDLVIKSARPAPVVTEDPFLEIFLNRLSKLQRKAPLPAHFRQPDSIMRLLWSKPTSTTLPAVFVDSLVGKLQDQVTLTLLPSPQHFLACFFMLSMLINRRRSNRYTGNIHPIQRSSIVSSLSGRRYTNSFPAAPFCLLLIRH